MRHRLTGRLAALLLLALPVLLFPPHGAEAQQAPGAPANFQASTGTTRAITLTWDNPNDPTITAYQLRRTVGGVTTDWLEFGSHATTHVAATIEYGVQYTFELRAVRGSTAGASATVTVLRRAAPPPPGGGGGGGGGGGVTAPRPSKADFEWTVTHDLEALAAGNDQPTGAWSDGSTLWLANNADGPGDAVYAYDLESGERTEEREFALDERNRAPRGIWAGGGTAWVSDSGRDRLFAYHLESGERLPGRDIHLVAANANARGLWGGGGRIWVLDGNRLSLFAYDEASGAPLGEYALDAANGEPYGVWSDGVTVWVSDHGAKRLFAYRLPGQPGEGETAPGERVALERVKEEEFTQLSKASNNSPRGIWSDGAVMYVVDALDARVYTYNMPDAIDARLASLTLAGIEFGDFSPLRTEYEGGAETGVEETTVEAVPAQTNARVAIEPADDDDGGEGYQVTLAGIHEITVTVTSPDGSRTRVYRVRLAGPEEPVPPHRGLDEVECLRGPVVAGGFSLVLAGGGSIDDLTTCAAERGVAALYALLEGEWVSYILAAPDGPFRELFAENLAGTPLVARGAEGTAAGMDTRLASLALDGVSFGAFSPGRTEYAGTAEEGLTHATVEAVPAREGATVAIAPPDADGDPANGHQVALEAAAPVTVTVTSGDGTRTVVYRVWTAGADGEQAPDGEPAPDCLRGVTGPGFSLVVHEGGSVEQLAICARSLGVTALFALSDGEYVPYFPSAPDFVNEAFRELFPHGLPPETPLVAASSDGN